MIINKPFIGDEEVHVIVLGTDPTWKPLINYRKEHNKECDDFYIRVAFGLSNEDMRLYKEVIGQDKQLPFFNQIQ